MFSDTPNTTYWRREKKTGRPTCDSHLLLRSVPVHPTPISVKSISSLQLVIDLLDIIFRWYFLTIHNPKTKAWFKHYTQVWRQLDVLRCTSSTDVVLWPPSSRRSQSIENDIGNQSIDTMDINRYQSVNWYQQPINESSNPQKWEKI